MKTIKNKNEDLFEIEDFQLIRFRTSKVNPELEEKIKRTWENLRPNQAFCVPKNLAGIFLIRKIFKEELDRKEIRLQAIGDAIYSKKHTGVRIIKIK